MKSVHQAAPGDCESSQHAIRPHLTWYRAKARMYLPQISLVKRCFQFFIFFFFLFDMAHYKRPELEPRRRHAPPAHVHLLMKARDKTSNTYLVAYTRCASRNTKEQRLPSPSLFLYLKGSKQILFLPGNCELLEIKQQLFKTLNILGNTGELKKHHILEE